ncbi:MAG TPA: hypothetical protein VJ501_05590 [Burkholderiaceae bacterium]|nr:hypothetical protein [Burkholderiaceae bacterium]
MIDVKINGLAELQQALDQVPAKIEKNVLRGGLLRGMRVILPEARRNINSISGLLANGLKISTGSRGGRVFSYMRARGKHGYVAKWVEFGTKAHRITAKDQGWLSLGGIFRKTVQHPGAKPKPFMRPALESKAGAAVIAAAEYMRNRLESKHGLDTSDLTFDREE